ncbi:MAG TPA: hypothetical protein VGD98_09460 [Ktedonobacteraceae bacterium]
MQKRDTQHRSIPQIKPKRMEVEEVQIDSMNLEQQRKQHHDHRESGQGCEHKGEAQKVGRKGSSSNVLSKVDHAAKDNSDKSDAGQCKTGPREITQNNIQIKNQTGNDANDNHAGKEWNEGWIQKAERKFGFFFPLYQAQQIAN